MYFNDAYPEITQEEQLSFQATERRLIIRLVVIGSFSLALLLITLL